jgi:hypothetical protein
MAGNKHHVHKYSRLFWIKPYSCSVSFFADLDSFSFFHLALLLLLHIHKGALETCFYLAAAYIGLLAAIPQTDWGVICAFLPGVKWRRHPAPRDPACIMLVIVFTPSAANLRRTPPSFLSIFPSPALNTRHAMCSRLGVLMSWSKST